MTAPRLRSEEVLRVLADVRAGEREMWESRIRHADPDTSKEHRECFKEEMGGFDLMADAIESKSVGENVENATLAMDDLQRRLWASLTSVLTARNLTLTEAKTDHVARPLMREIERLRPIRDLLYSRRCYPQWSRQRS